MFKPSARVLADSLASNGKRLTTMEVTGHRFILAEFNTHRAFSRNSASSRAIPYKKMREKAMEQTAFPVVWPAEQKGMQGGDEVSSQNRFGARIEWALARNEAVKSADRLHQLGVHKSVINRLLEPFLPHTIIVSATEWDGFWAQRCHEDAQPEIRVLAEEMFYAFKASSPRVVDEGDWHLPLVHAEDYTMIMDEYPRATHSFAIDILKKLSVARCARVSYLTHEGTRDHDKDLELYDRLFSHKPAHASPFEHVATPSPSYPEHYRSKGNFAGWVQLRHLLDLG